jgi:hypothetical protein
VLAVSYAQSDWVLFGLNEEIHLPKSDEKSSSNWVRFSPFPAIREERVGPKRVQSKRSCRMNRTIPRFAATLPQVSLAETEAWLRVPR